MCDAAMLSAHGHLGSAAKLTSRRRRPAPGSWAATVVELPGLYGARVAVLGLHYGERDPILHLHAGDVTMECYRAVRTLPALRIRDNAGRWHATNHYAPRRPGGNGEVTLQLAIVPLLEAGTRGSTW